MASTPSYPTYPAGMPPQPIGPIPAQLAVAEAARQRRATVAFRIILVIPHSIVLYFLQLAAVVVAFVGWWGALFTGSLPDFAHNYLTGYIRWYARVSAYMFLLTDLYPPFTLDEDPTYPVRVATPPRQPLNRLAVFFRLILVFPAEIVILVLVMGGNTIVIFIAWLITLVTGKLPASLHLAFTAVLRYLTRSYCYWFMLTPAYPGGLFGDAPDAPSWGTPPTAAGAPPADGTPPEYGTAPGYGTPPGYNAPPEYGTAPGYGTSGSVYGAPGGYGATRSVFEPASWGLVLTAAARRLLVLFLVLGSLLWVGYGALIATAASSANNVNTTNNAIDKLNSSYDTLTSNLSQWQNAVAACDQNLTCVTKADGKAATYFSSFENELRATPMPSGASAAASRLDSDATSATRDFTELSQATTVEQYQNTLTSTGLQQTLERFDQDYNALGAALENS